MEAKPEPGGSGEKRRGEMCLPACLSGRVRLMFLSFEIWGVIKSLLLHHRVNINEIPRH